jgi:RNA recognition motif-containing protein
VEVLTARPLLPALLTRRELALTSTGDCRALLLTIFRLYCTNLPDKRIQKNDLRTALYSLFSTYGTVLDVVAMKTSKMRGQAHIVFKDVQASTQALRALQGFEFFGKQMVCFHLPSLVANPAQSVDV